MSFSPVVGDLDLGVAPLSEVIHPGSWSLERKCRWWVPFNGGWIDIPKDAGLQRIHSWMLGLNLFCLLDHTREVIECGQCMAGGTLGSTGSDHESKCAMDSISALSALCFLSKCTRPSPACSAHLSFSSSLPLLLASLPWAAYAHTLRVGASFLTQSWIGLCVN